MNGKDVRVRSAAKSDLLSVLAIETAAFADPWTLDSFESALALPHFRFMIAERLAGPADDPSASAGTIVGYIIIVSMSPEAEIANIAVAPSERGVGVGTRLLRSGLEVITGEGVQTVYLEVRESNAGARALYEHNGFEPVGRRRGYYDKPREDALILRRDLDGG